MRKSFKAWGCASVLAMGCGDDTGSTLTDGSSSSTTTVEPGMSTGLIDPTTTISADDTSTTSTTGSPGTTTDPGESSSSTGPVPTCGDGVVDGDDICDGSDLAGEDCVSQGFEEGTLACADDCSGFDTRGCVNMNCGDNEIQGREACDGTDFGVETCQSLGFDSGTLVCELLCDAIDDSGCGTCGNVIVDGDEVCDDVVLFGETCESQGFSSGVLACTPDCLNYDTASCIVCGNDIIDGVEPCDGVDLGGLSCVSEGFVGGVLVCDPDCALDTTGCNSCGNDIVDAGEGCDGMNLDGQTCASLGLMGGTLSCSPSCQYDFSACDIPGMQFGSDTGYDGYVIPGLPMLPCDDISATGTATGLSDDSQIVVPIGFSFPVYGVNFNNVTIQSNGALHFDTDTYMTLANSCLPTATNPSAHNVYVFWDDLNPNSGEVYYQTLGPMGDQRFVVQWDTPHFGGDVVDVIRVQAMLHEASGQIEVCYPDTLSAANVGDNGAQATSGIQQSSAVGFHYSCNTPDLIDGTLLFYIPV